MAKITIELNDIDLDKGTFSAALAIEGAKTDDGFVTAAHMTGAFIMHAINTPEFLAGCMAFAEATALGLGDGRVNAPQPVEQTPDGVDANQTVTA